MITVEVFFPQPAGSIGKLLIESAIKAVLQKEHKPRANVRCVFLSNADIRIMNKAYLGHDYPTDVISFTLEEEPLEAELYIGLETARRQAKEYKVPLREEVARLAIHGTLHLCGFDDATEDAKREMTRAEENYLALLRKRQILNK